MGGQYRVDGQEFGRGRCTEVETLDGRTRGMWKALADFLIRQVSLWPRMEWATETQLLFPHRGRGPELGEGPLGMLSGFCLHELCWERSLEPQVHSSPPRRQLLVSRLCSPGWRHQSLESLHLRIQKRSLLRCPSPSQCPCVLSVCLPQSHVRRGEGAGLTDGA